MSSSASIAANRCIGHREMKYQYPSKTSVSKKVENITEQL